ncbi:MAG TPA: tRNA lysidine(34) synthetase TilS, partial [Vicinamibacterales bacterium]|nr:tRNA lysidine(34) synthetase TilS [Vicinamibacterales bacterium]
PAAAATVARSAAHLADAQRLLAETAAADAAGILDDGRISLEGLGQLSRERQFNVLRWWLRQEGLKPPPTAMLGSALRDFFAARPDGAPALRWDDGELRRYRGRLYAIARLPETMRASGGVVLDLGGGLGRFALVPSRAGGIRKADASGTSIRFRGGGESLRPHAGRPRKRLKDLCQEAGIVPWMRDRLPLVYLGERLAAVGDLWIDVEFAAEPGAPALKPVWEGRPRIF